MSLAALIAAVLVLATSAVDQADAETAQDLIHSDLPLWANEPEVMWPRSFDEDDGTFGCATRIRHGDWRYDENSPESEPSWYRLTNYGVFHCFMIVQDAYERSDLANGDVDYSFLIQLGTIQGRDGPVELWALQRGGRPGSDYLLLARRPAPGIVVTFDVLQRECPRGHIRETPPLDILSTRYCAINSRRELTKLARRMASRPPLGRLTFVEPAEGED